jgi:ABC-type oligopeptide transport system substrate-binding subunit
LADALATAMGSSWRRTGRKVTGTAARPIAPQAQGTSRARLPCLAADTAGRHLFQLHQRLTQPPQVIDGGWDAGYPSADDFIGRLDCDHFVSANGPATTDASEFCNPAVDRQIARAAAAQTTDATAAAGLWARLDRQLTDLVILVPAVVPNQVDLLSSRTGNYQHNPVWGVLLDQLWVR